MMWDLTQEVDSFDLRIKHDNVINLLMMNQIRIKIPNSGKAFFKLASVCG